MEEAWFLWKGESSLSRGLRVLAYPASGRAAAAYRRVEIPGRSGLVTLTDPPVYEAAETGSFFDNITNYLMVLLTVLIAALLIFVIIRGTSPVEVTETEPELSVEDLLETTRDDTTALEEIELEDKSETRIMIEKFVDENPEAVALLLRNWINEDWGGV